MLECVETIWNGVVCGNVLECGDGMLRSVVESGGMLWKMPGNKGRKVVVYVGGCSKESWNVAKGGWK